jgi:hypothetical protein
MTPKEVSPKAAPTETKKTKYSKPILKSWVSESSASEYFKPNADFPTS